MGLGTYLASRAGNRLGEPVHQREAWYEAYMEALFEHDPARMAGAIRTATDLIARRQRELIVGRSTSFERRALKEALHTLDALKMLQH